MPTWAVVLVVLALLCLTAVAITWRLTDPLLEKQVERAIDAEQRAEWNADEVERLASDKKLLRNQLLMAGLTPVTDSPPAPRPLRAVDSSRAPEAPE